MENDLVKQQHEEAKIEKFKIFAERNAQSTKDYAQIFSQLVTRYDSINSQDFSGQKAVRKFLEARKISNETSLDAPYIHFGICTEVIKNEGGRWMAFPKIQKGKVIAIMIAYADKEDIRVGYREMGHTTDFYRDFVDVFQKAFDEEVSKNKGKNKANRGETLIDEVVITYFNSNRQDWNQLRSLIFDLGRFEHYRQYNFWDGCNYSNGLDEQCIAYGMCENNKDVYYHYEDPPLNPCDNIKKNVVNNPNMKEPLKKLTEKSKLSGEQGFKVKADGTVTDIIEGGAHSVNLGDTRGYRGAYHNHTPNGIKMQSIPDIIGIFEQIVNRDTNVDVSSVFTGMIGTDVCPSCEGGYKHYNYVVSFRGTEEEAKNLYQQYKNYDSKKDMNWYNDYADLLSKNTLYRNEQVKFLNTAGLEKLFFDSLKKKNLDVNKFLLQRIDEKGNVSNISMENNASFFPNENPCN